MKSSIERSSAFPAAITIIIFGACVLALGCHDVATTWSSEVRSPDGLWIATARSEQWGGPGTAYDATTVYLKSTKGSKSPTQVLLFSHQYATMNLKMEWLTATHLEVTYGASAQPGDRVSLDFQAVKYDDVNISVRDLSNQTRKP